ncbi:metallophosphoesterase [Gemmobacter sp. JM10B15]|uniref:Metallophosphoesterase n=1 Tax=Gemmobacter denitrificans TaxID=3123040 RepID=A0ABU8BTR6_9RHOB
MAPRPPFRVALIADPHLHDPQGNFGLAGFDAGDRPRLYRPWSEMRGYARGVNESLPALCAALERIAARGVRQVVIAGDISDDGQIENLRRAADLLTWAEDDLGLRIHLLPGNHDGYAIAGKHTAMRFVTGPGQTRLLTSDPSLPDAVQSPAMRCPGAADALALLARFGQRRREGDLHWESPFGLSDRPQDRVYPARSADGGIIRWLPDASCLIEPEPGLWLLLLDVTIFEPRTGIADPHRKRAFLDPSAAGWTAALRQKPYLFDWIADVCARAKTLGKVLVPVSHYPVLDHWPGLAPVLPGATLVRRAPIPQVAERLAAAGLRLHFGGHLHIHAQSLRATSAGPFTDVALPSTCAFPPAAMLLDGDAAGFDLTPLPLGDLPDDPHVTAVHLAEGHSTAQGGLGPSLAARHRTRALERKIAAGLPAELRPDALPDGISGDDLADLLMLIDAGPLAIETLSPMRIAHLHRLAARPATGWTAELHRLLAEALARADHRPDRLPAAIA